MAVKATEFAAHNHDLADVTEVLQQRILPCCLESCSIIGVGAAKAVPKGQNVGNASDGTCIANGIDTGLPKLLHAQVV